MAKQAPRTTLKDSILDRRALPLIPWSWETFLYVAILLLAAIVRFWDLGSRVLHHDESIHAAYSWYLFNGMGYKHDPMFHGPFLYYATALIYFLFGVSDYTARVAPAFSGVVLVGLPYLLRDRLGRTGALVAAFLLALSPSILYYSRSLRHDIFAATATLSLMICLWRYVDDRRPLWLYLATISLAISFASHELTYISVFILGSFLLLVAGPTLVTALVRGKRSLLSPYADFLILLSALMVPLGTPTVLLIQRRIAPTTDANTLLAITFFVLLSLAFILGLWWNRRIFGRCAIIFWVIFALLFSSLFVNPPGLISGAIGSLQYWLSQQGVRRGGQPWFYYLLLLPLYEFVPLLFGLTGILLAIARLPITLVRWLQRSHREPLTPLPQAEITDSTSGYNLFRWFLVYWFVLSLVIYSWAGEKMPWLVIHITIPLVLLAADFVGHILETTPWKEAVARGGVLLSIGLMLFIFALLGLGGAIPPALSLAQPLQTLRQTFQCLAILLVVAILVGGVVYYWVKIGHAIAWRITALTVLAILMAFSIRASWQLNYYHGDIPVEMLVYTQSSPDIAKVMREIKRVSFRTGTDTDIVIAYDNDVSWPFEWYLRDYKNRNYYGNDPRLIRPGAPIVLTGFESGHDGAVRAQLGNAYVGQRYKLRWWFPEDYRELTPELIWRGLGDATAHQRVWRYFLYRETFSPLGSLDFMMYERRDLATGPWVAAQAAKGEVSSIQHWGSRGKGLSQFDEPKGITVALDGSIYVVDSRNARIQKFDKQGHFVLMWGSPGGAVGQFNEPWGIAVNQAGNVFVADTWNHRIQKFDGLGRFLAVWGHYGNVKDGSGEPGTFYGPRGIAIDAMGNVYVTDTGNNRIQKFDNTGKYLTQYGTQGTDDGQFNEPVGIAIDAGGNILIADTWNRRIQKFDRNFNLLAKWPVIGWAGESVLNKPYLATDRFGAVYVTDPEGCQVLKFDPNGRLLADWGKPGEDATYLRIPTGIAIDAQGSIFIADSLNHRILKFAPVP
ncbi:MAG: TIGR03663 family protein [Chloroflexi bacterium]|nr:TIGR03663 family protein [Chloroflexota bacterium]MCL5075558.1 TIGR03663 family protein [Chloroflexota bacterium]